MPFAASFAAAFALAPDRADAQQLPAFRWAGDSEGGAPYVEADPHNPERVVGLDVEIAELIAKELGRTAGFVQIAFTSLDQSAARGDFDIALDGIEDTPARRASLAVTVPYYEFREVLTVRAADATRFRSLADLRGRRVATLGGTTAYELLLAAETRARRRARSRTTTTCIRTRILLNGRVDAVLLDNVIAERSMRRMPGLATQPDAVAVGHYVGMLGPARTAAARSDRQHLARRDGATAGSRRSCGAGSSGTTISRSCTRASHRVVRARRPSAAGDSVAAADAPAAVDRGRRRRRWRGSTCRRCCRRPR